VYRRTGSAADGRIRAVLPCRERQPCPWIPWAAVTARCRICSQTFGLSMVDHNDGGHNDGGHLAVFTVAGRPSCCHVPSTVLRLLLVEKLVQAQVIPALGQYRLDRLPLELLQRGEDLLGQLQRLGDQCDEPIDVAALRL
jgi:hypothetical protein